MAVRAEQPPLFAEALDGALRRWRMLLLGLAIGCVVGVPVALLMPMWFQAGVRMIPAPRRQLPPRMPGFEPLEGATPEDITGPGGADGAGELGRLLSILHSRSLTDEAITHFDLLKVYSAKNIEDMRELFWNRLAITSLVPKEGYVELIYEDTDPRRASELANFMAATANNITRKLSSAAASQERQFLEHRVGEARTAMEAAAQTFREFQEKQKLVSIDVQADAVIGTMLRLKEQLIDQELELSRLRGFSSAEEPAAAQTRHHVQNLRGQIERLEESPALAEPVQSPTPDYFTHLDQVPALRQQSERLARDLKLKTSIYELLVRQYEVAKLAEVRDTRSFEVLDSAVQPTRKSRPSRALVVAAAAMLGLLAAFGALAGKTIWQRLRA